MLDLPARLVEAARLEQELREVVARCRVGRFQHDRARPGVGCGCPVAVRIGDVAAAEPGVRFAGPARDRGVVGRGRRASLPRGLEAGGRGDESRRLRVTRTRAPHQGDHREAPAAVPGAGKALPFHLDASYAPGAKQGDAALRVVADEHGEMPARQPRHAEVLQHEHGPARFKFLHHLFGGRRQDVGQAPVAARGADELEGEAAAPLREVDLGRERLRRHVDAARDQQGRERGGTALVVFLREEGRRVELYRARRGSGQPVDERRRGRATGQRDRKCRDDQCAAVHVFLKMSMTPTSSRMIRTTNTTPITASASPPAGASPIWPASVATSAPDTTSRRPSIAAGSTPNRSSSARTSARASVASTRARAPPSWLAIASAVPTMPAEAGACMPREMRLALSTATQARRNLYMRMVTLRSYKRWTKLPCWTPHSPPSGP